MQDDLRNGRVLWRYCWVLMAMSWALFAALALLPLPQHAHDTLGAVWMATSLCALGGILTCAVGLIFARWRASWQS